MTCWSNGLVLSCTTSVHSFAAVPLTIVFSVWAFEIAFVSAKAMVRQRRLRLRGESRRGA